MTRVLSIILNSLGALAFLTAYAYADSYEMGDTVEIGVVIVVDDVLSWEAYCLSDPVPPECVVYDDDAPMTPEEQRQQLTEWRR